MIETLRENSRLLAGATLVVVGGALLGAVLGTPPPANPKTELMRPGYFFWHNIRVTILLWLGGATFGLLSFLTLLYNGAQVGFVAGNGAPVLFVAGLAPHGVFELTGFIVAGAAGFKLPWEVTRYLLGQKKRILRGRHFRQAGELALLSALLIAVAAVIEAYVTPAAISAIT